MIYKVRKGEHNFKPNRFRFHAGMTAGIWEVVFNETNLYEQLDWENDWNKLLGWSYGLLPRYDHKIYGKAWYPAHHYNSVRVSWRAAKWLRRIELGLYVYDHEERRTSRETLFVPTNTPIRLIPQVSAGFFRLRVQHNLMHLREPKKDLIEMPFNVPASWGYMLNPEFIDAGSPQPMHLSLTRIK